MNYSFIFSKTNETIENVMYKIYEDFIENELEKVIRNTKNE